MKVAFEKSFCRVERRLMHFAASVLLNLRLDDLNTLFECGAESFAGRMNGVRCRSNGHLNMVMPASNPHTVAKPFPCQSGRTKSFTVQQHEFLAGSCFRGE